MSSVRPIETSRADVSAEEKIKRYLSARLMIEFGDEIDEHSDLFQLGLLDSQAYIELIRFVETEFGLRLTNEQILSNVFVSVAGIKSLVAPAE